MLIAASGNRAAYYVVASSVIQSLFKNTARRLDFYSSRLPSFLVAVLAPNVDVHTTFDDGALHKTWFCRFSKAITCSLSLEMKSDLQNQFVSCHTHQPYLASGHRQMHASDVAIDMQNPESTITFSARHWQPIREYLITKGPQL